MERHLGLALLVCTLTVASVAAKTEYRQEGMYTGSKGDVAVTVTVELEKYRSADGRKHSKGKITHIQMGFRNGQKVVSAPQTVLQDLWAPVLYYRRTVSENGSRTAWKADPVAVYPGEGGTCAMIYVTGGDGGEYYKSWILVTDESVGKRFTEESIYGRRIPPANMTASSSSLTRSDGVYSACSASGANINANVEVTVQEFVRNKHRVEQRNGVPYVDGRVARGVSDLKRIASEITSIRASFGPDSSHAVEVRGEAFADMFNVSLRSLRTVDKNTAKVSWFTEDLRLAWADDNSGVLLPLSGGEGPSYYRLGLVINKDGTFDRVDEVSLPITND